MHCAPQLVTAHVDGELRLAQSAWMAAHVQACPRCRQQVRDERALRAALKALPEPPLPEDLLASIGL